MRWIEVDHETLTLNPDDVEAKITSRTALVAVDAVHAAPHLPIDRDALGADVLTCSAYKFFGPHVGIAAVKRELLEDLEAYKLEPAPDYVPDKLETGTQNHEGIAGVGGAIEFIASLGQGPSLREELVSGMRAIEEHEADLAGSLRTPLREMSGIRLYSAPDGVPKTPTIAFRIEGRDPREFCQYMAGEGFFVVNGHFYASTLARKLGIAEKGGWVRAGLAPYNTGEEVEGFIELLQRFLQTG